MKMNVYISEYYVYFVILDLGLDVNILTKKTWEIMGKPKLVWSPVYILLENESKMSMIGLVPHLPVEVEGLKTYVDFDVIEIVNNTSPYTALLGINWEMENLVIINFKKRMMTFENHDARVLAPLDPLEGR